MTWGQIVTRRVRAAKDKAERATGVVWGTFYNPDHGDFQFLIRLGNGASLCNVEVSVRGHAFYAERVGRD